MVRREALYLLAGFTGSPHAFTKIASGQTTSDAAKISWVAQLLEEMGRIKPGMTRGELLTVFKTEGGLSTGLEWTYVSQHCPYFKVDVTFRAVGRPETDESGATTLVQDKRDRIATISRPYLQFSIMD